MSIPRTPQTFFDLQLLVSMLEELVESHYDGLGGYQELVDLMEKARFAVRYRALQEGEEPSLIEFLYQASALCHAMIHMDDSADAYIERDEEGILFAIVSWLSVLREMPDIETFRQMVTYLEESEEWRDWIQAVPRGRVHRR